MHLETTLTSEKIYEGKIINLRRDVVRLENGTEAVRETIEHKGGVCVVAIDENDDIFLVRQFRYPYKKEIWEIPAGKLEVGEEPVACAARELLEETGLTAEHMESLGKLYPSPGYVDEIIYMYFAEELKMTKQQLDEDEFLSVQKLPLKKAIDMILSGEIADAKTQAAVLKYFFKRRLRFD